MEAHCGRIVPPLPPKSTKFSEREDAVLCKNSRSYWVPGVHYKNRIETSRTPPPTRVNSDTVAMSPSVSGQTSEVSQTFSKKSYSLNSRSGKGFVGKIASAFSEPVGKRRENSFKITWADNSKKCPKFKKNDEEFLYQNVSNTGTNYIEYKLKNIKDGKASKHLAMKTEDHLGKSRVSNKVLSSAGEEKTDQEDSPTWMTASTRQIQVHQVKNKTVVKISINDRPEIPNQVHGNYFKPLNEDDLSEYQYPELFINRKNSKLSNTSEYAEPFSGPAPQVYANVDLSKKRRNQSEGQIYENADGADVGEGQVYMNVANGEVYANLDDDEDKTPVVAEHHYLNVNGAAIKAATVPETAADDADQVYENEDFTVLRNSQVTQSIIQKNQLPIKEDVYENTDFMAKNNVFNEIHFSGPGLGDGNGYQTPKSPIRLVVHDEPNMFPIKKKFTNNTETQHPMENGQYSLIDTLDSGNSSDPENMPSLSPIAMKDKVIVTVSGRNELEERGHKRAESITSSGVGIDSEVSDTEESNISCDSLNSNDLHGCSISEDHGYHTPTPENKTTSPVGRMEYELSKSPSPELINDSRRQHSASYEINRSCEAEGADIIQQVANAAQRIRNLRLENNLYLARRIESCEDVYENCESFSHAPVIQQKPITLPTEDNEPKEDQAAFIDGIKTLPKGLLKDIQSRNVRSLSAYPKGEKDSEKIRLSQDVVNVFQSPNQTVGPVKKLMSRSVEKNFINERTYEERKTESRICGLALDTDKFYKFHLKENLVDSVCEEKNNPEDETFAGYRDFLARERPAAITSAKGTIRGVKNRVKAGIATFLQLQENKLYKDKDAGKIVVYSTTMGIVRETYQKCLKVKQILKTLMVKFEERDVFMSSEAQDEIRDRMKCDAILVPQVFVEGQHIGDAETIERLNESGELRKILKPYKSHDSITTCNVCGGYRLLPCRICKGSKKSVHRNHFTAEFVSLKCMNCDPVGLMKCYAC